MKLFQVFATIVLLVISLTIHADVLIVANKKSPIQSLNIKDVKKIFLGRLRMIPNTEIEPNPVDMPQDSMPYQHFYEQVIGLSPPKLKRYRAYYLFSGKGKIPQEAPSHKVLYEILESDPNAIAYIMDSTPMPDDIRVLLKIGTDSAEQEQVVDP